MSKLIAKGIELNLLLSKLNKLVPLYLAESWDNVGLLIGPSKVQKVSKLLLTNDLTVDVLEEAIDNRVNFIFTYHPNIFVPLKTVNYSNNWNEKIVVNCIENSIAVFSPHTALDAIENGVNDWIVSAFNFKIKRPIECKSSEDGQTLLENVGIGRRIELVEPLSIQKIVEISKKHFNLTHLRLALATGHNEDTMIKSIAVCAGSGYTVLKKETADLYITGELGHHQALDFNHKGTSVILTEHSNCERGYLQSIFVNLLNEELGENMVDCILSVKDHDPLKIV